LKSPIATEDDLQSGLSQEVIRGGPEPPIAVTEHDRDAVEGRPREILDPISIEVSDDR
jgi:hypothetical protein